MHHLINERKVLLALCYIGLGVFVLTEMDLFARPVQVSEKGLAILLLAIVLFLSGFVLVTKAIRKVQG
jgi:hypothetical protein